MRELTSGPVFVVGPSRSGTSLLRSALNGHSQVHLAGETHYFDDLRPRLGAAAQGTLSPEQREDCEHYFLRLAHRPYGHQGDDRASRLDRAVLDERAQALGRGGDAFFEAFCQLDAGEHDAQVWGEKTPRHVFRIADIVSAYPDAQVICMVRDPRAVVASYRDWRNQGGFDLEKDPGHALALEDEEARTQRSYDIRLASLLWRATVNAAHEAASRFGDEGVRIQRYEDVVTAPEEVLRAVSAWLGLDFEPSMLDVPMHNSSFSAFQAAGGVSTAAMERWRATLSARETATIQDICAGPMAEYGYAQEETGVSRAAVAMGWATFPVAVVRAANANRDRTHSLPAYLWRRARLALKRS